jgi:hypothetical protein
MQRSPTPIIPECHVISSDDAAAQVERRHLKSGPVIEQPRDHLIMTVKRS